MCRSIILIILIHMTSIVLGGIIQVPEDQPSIQAGINAAVNGDTVLVADSTYYENINFMGKAITVASYYIIDGDTTHRDSTIIDGSQPVNPNAASVVTFESGEDTTSILCGFTITAGTGKWYSIWSARVGGGINCYYSSCKIVANKIINNSVTGPFGLGGGMASVPASNAYVVLKDNRIVHNMVVSNSDAAFGGGLLLNTHAKLTGNIISYNSCNADPNSQVAYGGGIFIQPGSIYLEIIMENNTITHNSVSSYGNNLPSGGAAAAGGGIQMSGCYGKMTKNEISFNEIWNYSSTGVIGNGLSIANSHDSLLVEANIIRGNTFHQGIRCFGGGLMVQGTGTVSFINNLIEGNHAIDGGGVEIANNISNPGTAIFINNTIVNNTATYGGGIQVYEANGYVMNTIIWGNQASTNAAIDIYNGVIDVAYCDVQGSTVWPGMGNISLEPQYEAGDTLYHLSSSSPCINTGIDSLILGGMMCYCPCTDFEGNPRPFPGTPPDMGWDETDVPVEITASSIVEFPETHALYQNYPNPFNPTTVVSFQLSANSFVSLKVYDITGREVATLVSENLLAGSHRYEWDASGMASGVYFYRLNADNFKQTRKMILVR